MIASLCPYIFRETQTEDSLTVKMLGVRPEHRK